MEEPVAETSPASEETTPLDADVDPIAQSHSDAVRRGTEQNGNE